MAISPYLLQQNQNPALGQLQGQQYQPGNFQGESEPNFWENLGNGLRDFFVGQPSGLQKVQNFEPHQIQALNQLLGQSFSQLQNPYQGFEGLANESQRNFSENIIPSLAERFTNVTNGRTSSPAFAGQLGAAGAGLSSMLNAQKAQFGQENQANALRGIALGLTPQSQYVPNPGSSGLLGGIGNLVGQAAPTLAQGALSYGTGGLTGAPAIASLIGQIFKKK